MQTRFFRSALLVVTALGLSAIQPMASANPAKRAAPGTPPPPPIATNKLGNASLAQCAPGFTKTLENKGSTGYVTKYVCTTPVIRCPKNPNYTQAAAEGKVNSNSIPSPEQGALTLLYTCTYWTPEQ